MKNLKFRAWDKRREDFRNDIFVDTNGNLYQFSKITGYGQAITYLDNEHIVLMQSTGFKDKNGKEIFEGDIVQYLDGEYSFTGVVENSVFGIYAKNKYDNYRFEDFADENTKEADVVVIGNIYEDKGLLENERGKR